MENTSTRDFLIVRVARHISALCKSVLVNACSAGPNVLAASSAKKRRCIVSRRPSHEPRREIISQGYFD